MRRKYYLTSIAILIAILVVVLIFLVRPTYYEVPPLGVGVFVSSGENRWYPPQWPPPEGVQYRPMSYGEARAKGIAPGDGVDTSLRGPSRLELLLLYYKAETFPLRWNQTGIDALWKKSIPYDLSP